MNFRLLAACVVVGFAASACGNSGSSAVPTARLGAGQSQPSSPPSAGGGTAASAQRSSMTITITIPARKGSAQGRRARTVSPNIAYLDVVLQSLNGTAQPVNGPYSVLIPVSQLNGCSSGGTRSTGRSVQSLGGCYTTTVPAPIGSAVYAIGVLDGGMTLLDYAEGAAVGITGNGNDSLTATLNGVGATVAGSYVFTDPGNAPDPLHCNSYEQAYDVHAVCSYTFHLVDNSGDDMADGGTGHGANRVALTVTDLTAQQAMNIAHDDYPSSVFVANEVDFDPAVPASSTPSNYVVQGGALPDYTTFIRPELSDIPAGETHMVEFKAVLSAAATTAFGPNVIVPAGGTFTWDLPCRHVIVGPNDPSGVGEGTHLEYCDPTANLNLTVN
jgi:hypothetical protein